MMQYRATLDMYRRIPADLLEGTMRGSVLSICAIVIMVTLFLMETRAFFTTELVSDLILDRTTDLSLSKVRVNFNVTMYDLNCEYAQVDVVSYLNTEQDVLSNIKKFSVDGNGVQKRFHSRNKAQNDILFYDETVTESIEELHENGEDAESLDADGLKSVLENHHFLFVDFFASWCSHCQKLAPTWESLAELMHEAAKTHLDELISVENETTESFSEEEYKDILKLIRPVHIAKVDCVQQGDLCRSQFIRAYPTLRLFVGGKYHSDYREDRTLLDFTHYLSQVETKVAETDPHVDSDGGVQKTRDMAQGRLEWMGEAKTAPRRTHQGIWRADEHPGCQISGFLNLEPVPGNFHIRAKSGVHDLVPSMTNMSHEVHELTFGKPIELNRVRNNQAKVPALFEEQMSPIENFVYVTEKYHSSYQHHIKVVRSEYEYAEGFMPGKGRKGTAYQLQAQSQLTLYNEDVVPEARFVYDFSPVAIRYRTKSRKWYDYVTSVMAIVGGTFTVIGMLDSSIHLMAKNKKMH